MNDKSKSTLEKYENVLRVKNYSKRTIEIYSHYVSVFLSFFECDAYHISKSETKSWLQSYRYSSISQQNQFISSVKLFYKYIIKSELKGVEIERPRKEKKLPKVIDKKHLLNSISKIKNSKHKLIISLAYSTGMRVSEIINLKINDIDFNRRLILIRQGKGRKDRYAPLSSNVEFLMYAYADEFNPDTYLFNGQCNLQYSRTSCNNIVKKYIGNEYHFHELRHSFATTIMEDGVDLRIIQKLLGHKSSKTTEIYTHVSNNVLQNINQPI